MRIVQSFWSKPVKGTAGWANKSLHYMSWALSCLSLKRIYSEVELITDELGYQFLIEKLGLPYTKVYVKLNAIDCYSEKLWALGKIYAYSIQNKPFIHVDGDVYIWSKFPAHLLNASLIAQNIEENYPPNFKYVENLIGNGFSFAEELKPKSEIPMINAGILGGNRIDFFKRYTDAVFNFVNCNKYLIDSMPNEKSGTLNIIFEQYFYYCLAQKEKIEINCLFNENEVGLTYFKVLDFYTLPTQTTYIHAIGKAKKELFYGELIAKHLWNEYPEYYNKIISLSKADKL